MKQECDTFRVDGFKLAVEVEAPPKILLGALRQRMLELSGARADGAILGMPSADLAKSRPVSTAATKRPCLLDLGAYGCVDLDEILPSRPLGVASADPANSLPLRK